MYLDECSRAFQDEPNISLEEAMRRLEEQEALEAQVDEEPMSMDAALRRAMEQNPGPYSHKPDSDADSDEYQSDVVTAHTVVFQCNDVMLRAVATGKSHERYG
jgi:hypothetical protein